MGWLRDRKEHRLRELDGFRQARRLADEDVAVFGEQLSELHVETMTDDLSPEARRDYQRALASYDAAKQALDEAEKAQTTQAVVAVNDPLNDGRFHLACVLARRDGDPLPTRREPCFFNPQHGPGVEDVEWTPPHGVARQITVCRSDLNRITAGEQPDVRLVRVGNRYVPWYAAERTRGVLGSTLGMAAVEDVSPHLLLEADIARSIRMPGGGGGGMMLP